MGGEWQESKRQIFEMSQKKGFSKCLRFPVIAVKVIFIWKNIKIILFYFLKFILPINILK
jgi:hypothetical protein